MSKHQDHMYHISQLSTDERKFLFMGRSFSEYAVEVECFDRFSARHTIDQICQRPGVTFGGGVESRNFSHDYTLRCDAPLHFSLDTKGSVGCGKHHVVPRRSSLPFSYFVRQEREVCGECLRAWMHQHLDLMEVER